jgi:hypothetical protein
LKAHQGAVEFHPDPWRWNLTYGVWLVTVPETTWASHGDMESHPEIADAYTFAISNRGLPWRRGGPF